MRFLSVFCLMLFFMVSFGASNMPANCEMIPNQERLVTLKTKKYSLFLIHNTSDSVIWITHPVINPGASAGWTSQIAQGNWSALVLNEGPFALSCIESKPGHEQEVSCSEVVAVCKWKGVKIPKDTQGQFWVAEDKSLSALITAIGARGFVVPVTSK